MPSKAFFFGSNLRFSGRQSTVTIVFTRWPRENSLPISWALGITCWHFILIKKLKTLLSFLIILVSLRLSFSDEGTFSVGVSEKTMENSWLACTKTQVSTWGKNPWRVHVSGNRCNMSTEFHDYLLKLRKNSASHHLPVI